MFDLLIVALLTGAQPAGVVMHGADEALPEELQTRLHATRMVVVGARTQGAKSKPHPGRALFEIAREAYRDLFFEEALPAFLRAKTAFEEDLLEPSEWPIYLHTLLHLALTYEALGNLDERDAVFAVLARYDVDPAVVDGRYPPQFRNRLLEQITRAPAKTAALRVESTPPGARIIVNGREVGRTPATVLDLRGGTHTVSLALDGYLTHTRGLDLHPSFGIGAEATPDLIEARLVPATGTDAAEAVRLMADGRLPPPDLTARLRKAQAAGGHAFGVFVAPARQRLVVAVLPTEGDWRGPSAFSADALEVPPLRGRVIAKIAALLEPLVLTESPPTVRPEPVDARIEHKDGTRWWLWSGIGVVVAGVLTAAAVAARSDDEPVKTGEAVVTWR